MIKYILFLFIGLYIFLFQVFSQSLEERWLVTINEGKQLYASGMIELALQKFSEASQIIPTDTTAYLYVIDCASRIKKPSLVYAGIEALENIRYHSPLLYQRGVMVSRDVQKDFGKARDYLQKGLALYPSNRELRNEELKFLYLKGEYTTAREKAVVFLQDYPDSYAVLTILLHIYFEVDEDYPKVLEILEKEIPVFPDSIYLQELEANVYLKSGDLEKAITRFENILSRNPRDARAYYNLARIYFDREDGEKAVEYSKKALEVDSLYLEALYNLGTYYYYWGLSYSQALSDMSVEQYLDQGKDFQDTAIYYFQLARPLFEKAIRLNPEELDAFENLNTVIALLENLQANQLQTAHLVPVSSEADSLVQPLDSLPEISTGFPELVIEDARVIYPSEDTASSGLHRGETGQIRFSLSNQGSFGATGLEAIVMQAVSMPDIEVQLNLPKTTLEPGESMEVLMPVQYLDNNNKTAAIERIQGVENKLRLFVQEAGGKSTQLVELPLELSEKKAAAASYSETEEIEFNPASDARNFLLLIAVDNYQQWPKLRTAVKDARDVKSVLEQKYRFLPSHTFEIYNEEAQLAKIRNALIKIKQEISAQDNLFIFYAGHGDYNSDFNEGAWIPVDAPLNSPTSYFQNSTLMNYLKSLNSKHIFLVADACFSGSLFVADEDVSYKEYNDQLSSRWALSSGNLEMVADGSGEANSSFAGFLIQALEDNKRDKISVSELIGFVKYMVKNTTSQSPVGKPLRVPGNEGGDYVLYVQ